MIDEFENLEEEIAQQLDGRSYDELMQELSGRVEQDQPVPESAGKGSQAQVERRLVRGRIIDLRGEDVFVSLTGFGGKDQGLVPLSQFDRAPKLGSIMDFVVDRHDEAQGLVHLSREGAVGRATWDGIQRGAAVEARVTGANKGGLEMEIAGGIRAFMPASQVGHQFIEDLETCVGEKYIAVVREVDRRSKKVVLSRREYLEIQRRHAREKLWKELEEGQVLEGKVTSVMAYGAFVDIGGLDGLVHVSDMSYQRVHHPKEVVKTGQSVEVKVLKIDRENERVGLGIKQVAPDPWDMVQQTVRAGDHVTGTVTRTTNFGAFVELEPGVEGLLPLGEISWKRIRQAADVVREGQTVRVMVLEIDLEKRRISLSLKQAHGDPWIGAESRYEKNSTVEGTVLSTTPFGAFVEIEDGIEALVHISQLADHRVAQVEDVLKAGDRKPFRVIGVDEQQRRMSLSLRSAGRSDDGSAQDPSLGQDRHGSSSSRLSLAKKKPFKQLKGGIE